MTPERLAIQRRYQQSEKGKATNKRWRNKPEVKAAAADYFQRVGKFKPKVKVATAKQSAYTRKSKYGVDETVYQEMWTAQKGKCAICGLPETARYRGQPTTLRVDHNHTTDKVRKLLCHACNAGLGLFKENPDRLRQAAAYLEENL